MEIVNWNDDHLLDLINIYFTIFYYYYYYYSFIIWVLIKYKITLVIKVI